MARFLDETLGLRNAPRLIDPMTSSSSDREMLRTRLRDYPSRRQAQVTRALRVRSLFDNRGSRIVRADP